MEETRISRCWCFLIWDCGMKSLHGLQLRKMNVLYFIKPDAYGMKSKNESIEVGIVILVTWKELGQNCANTWTRSFCCQVFNFSVLSFSPKEACDFILILTCVTFMPLCLSCLLQLLLVKSSMAFMRPDKLDSIKMWRELTIFRLHLWQYHMQEFGLKVPVFFFLT